MRASICVWEQLVEYVYVESVGGIYESHSPLLYTDVFACLSQVPGVTIATDIICGFPGEWYKVAVGGWFRPLMILVRI